MELNVNHVYVRLLTARTRQLTSLLTMMSENKNLIWPKHLKKTLLFKLPFINSILQRILFWIKSRKNSNSFSRGFNTNFVLFYEENLNPKAFNLCFREILLKVYFAYFLWPNISKSFNSHTNIKHLYTYIHAKSCCNFALKNSI